MLLLECCSDLSIMIVPSKLAASSGLFMMQSGPLSAIPIIIGMTVGFDASFCTADMALIMSSVRCFSPGKFAASQAVTDACVLMVLAMIHTWSGLSVCLHNDNERYRYQKGN